MELVERESGLIVPKQPQKPQRLYGALEIRDDSDRQECVAALKLLWHACGLHYPCRLGGDSREAIDGRERLFRYLSESLLGPDAPDFEQLT